MSAPDLSCFDYIIGLYNGDCPCYDCDFGTSDSGLYISDLLEPKMIDGLLNCDQGASICELMEIVRELAIRNFISDANALLMKQARLIRPPFKGGIGRTLWTKNLTGLSTGDYAGVRIRCADVRSGFLKITKIGLIPSANCTPDLLVYNLNGTLIDTISLTGAADKHTQTTVDLELPLHDEFLDNLEYYLVYQLDGSWLPKNNDVVCGCDKNAPEWGYFGSYNKKHNWAHWIMVGGWHDSALPPFNTDTLGSVSNYMNGLTLDAQLGCYVNELFCEDALDYDGNMLTQAMAVAIQKSAGALFIDKLLRTPNLNRTVMLDREGLAKAKEEYLASYQSMIQYIVDNLDYTNNDCIECRDVVDMIKSGIFA